MLIQKSEGRLEVWPAGKGLSDKGAGRQAGQGDKGSTSPASEEEMKGKASV